MLQNSPFGLKFLTYLRQLLNDEYDSRIANTQEENTLQQGQTANIGAKQSTCIEILIKIYAVLSIQIRDDLYRTSCTIKIFLFHIKSGVFFNAIWTSKKWELLTHLKI